MDDKKKIIIKISILVAVCAVSSFLLFPQLVSMEKTAKSISTLKNNIKALETDIKNLDGLKSELSTLTTKEAIYKYKMPPQEEFSSILENLSNMASINSVKIIAIEPRPPVYSESFYVEIPVFINAYCGYHQLGKFIDAVENSDRVMKITSLKINAGSIKDIYNHSVVITVSAYCTK